MPPRTFLLSLATLCLLLAAAPAARADASEIKGPTPEYRVAVERALATFNARDFTATRKQCDLLDKLTPNSAIVLNMRAAVELEERHYDAGAALCRQALEIEPKFFPAQFNLAEIPFLQKQYADARALYEELLAEDPQNELLQYRIFLTYLLEGNEAAAEEALKRVKYPGNTAAYYYAQAAWSMQHGRQADGEGWINSGDWVFSKAKNLNFIDVFYDLGWLKRPATAAEPAGDLVAK